MSAPWHVPCIYAAMPLEVYRRKRNFGVTPEPKGSSQKAAASGRTFIVQKHRASHLHYDFRLEHDGVLLSWAVPKGPSVDPGDKRLAMHTEDHPIEYGAFEGVIPAGEYGGGTVLLWDRGTWIPEGDPGEAYRQGKLKFRLEGEKLKGSWTLVRARGGKRADEKVWFLMKSDDAHAAKGEGARLVETMPRSVASGRDLPEIAADPDRVWHSNRSVADNVRAGAAKKRKPSLGLAKVAGTRKAAMPQSLAPQLATLAKAPPTGAGWVHE
ncbi:MAG: DNA polymerase ligase N-terminal domain-containing protein, partial [Casimicrobiaceae bacterium]